MRQHNELLDPSEWVDTYADYLYRFAHSRLQNSADAEDVVQETLLSAWKRREQFHGRSAERTWLTSILKNKIIDRFRLRSRDAENIDESIDVAELDTHFDSTGHSTLPSTAWIGSPSDAAEKSEFWTVFDDCVSGLPERSGGVFIMREVDQMESHKICEALQITPSNYWVRLHRARLKLRECLEVNWFENQDVDQC